VNINKNIKEVSRLFEVDVRKTHLGSRRMTDDELIDFLKNVCYGTLSFMADDDWPDSRTFNFTVYKDNFYFHANKIKGEKLKYLLDGQKVCINFFEPSRDIGTLRFCQHRSALVYGRLYRIDYSPDCGSEIYHVLEKLSIESGTPFKAIPERLEKSYKGCAVFRILPEYSVGKLTIFTSLLEKSYLETLLGSHSAV
jgi:nitroimidazol reductase NimA-like FMN-containing flavoprotein (pyridoxamine 5'-phosphate oxidase superfamily)